MMAEKHGANPAASQVEIRPPAPSVRTAFEAPFAFGDRVILDDDSSLVARVVAFSFRSHLAQIEIAWVHNGAACSAWVDTWRVKLAPT
jgi:hypothetical protein